MVKIDILIREGKMSRIKELELDRYLNFFASSSQDNLEHCKAVLGTFPRWSIISGYYAMHDITKLLLAKRFHLKVELEVHATTIKALKTLVMEKALPAMLEQGYHEFKYLANDLAEAKKERVKTQYFTGTAFMKEAYRKRAHAFLAQTVEPYLRKIRALLEEA